jgi:hypothetical protein
VRKCVLEPNDPVTTVTICTTYLDIRCLPKYPIYMRRLTFSINGAHFPKHRYLVFVMELCYACCEAGPDVLDAYTKWRTATTASLCLYVLSVCLHGIIFSKVYSEMSNLVKSDKNNWYFTRIPNYIYNIFSLNYSYSDIFYRHKL